ncbi:MAG: EAL domain-containing protein [Gammaproteobacteria bacterium]|nr:EAL domain-containing protein [Gammaproteobacteria bacterium]
MTWLDFVLGFRLLVMFGVFLAIVILRRRIMLFLKPAIFTLIVVALVLLIAAQITQMVGHASQQAMWRPISVWLFTFAGLIVFGGASWGIMLAQKLSKDYQQADQREQWLREVYENIPVAVFVLLDDVIIYSNHIYQSLQIKFNSENPFKDLEKSNQEVWLTSITGERHAFWVSQFDLENVKGKAYIVTDITSLKLQGSFIQKVAKDLNEKNASTVQSILALIHEFVPDSIMYVGEYNTESECFRYIAHQGECDQTIYNEMRLSRVFTSQEDWGWYEAKNLPSKDLPSLVSRLQAEAFGCVVLRYTQDQPLGVILFIQPKKSEVSDLLLDFLSIFSIRVRSELEHRQDKRTIEYSNSRYRTLIDGSNEAIVDISVHPSIYVDDQLEVQWEKLIEFGQVKEVNPAFLSLFQLDQTPSAQAFFEIKGLKHMMRYVIDSGYSQESLEVAHEVASGDLRWLRCTVNAEIEERRLHRLWIVIRDITDNKTHIQHLEHQTRHDNLTGLSNRVALREYLDEKIDQAKQFGFKTALLLVDLDRFKEVNDALGHHYGDVLLKKIEPRIREIVSEKRAFLARLGGDEFALVVPSVEGIREANEIATEIVRKLKEPFDLGQLNVEIGCSIGIAFYPDHGKETSTLLRCADVAMYKAKKDPSRILFYRSEMDESSPRRLALMADMNKGLRENEFFLVYQPKLDLQNNEIHCAEALIRWQHPELDLVNPAEFIPLAEMSDVIITMTHWVIDRTLAQIQEWLQQDIAMKIAVNVSTRNLLDEELIVFLKTKLNEYQVPANLLEIEITESALMVDPERALDTLKRISEMGVSISVDDFGTGYSSFIYLRQLPVDTLKIDIMFVRNMCINEQDEIIVNSIINLAHNLSLNVVAEGAEDLQTINRLKLMSCDMAQGYFVSKPVVADDFVVLLQGWIGQKF